MIGFNTMQCECCNKMVKVYVFVPYMGKNKALCERCAMELNPPKMNMILTKTNQVFNPLTKTIEKNITIKDLEKCGWFVRKIIEPVNGDTFVEAYYEMEYYGYVKCKRINYHEYPENYNDCLNTNCVRL